MWKEEERKETTAQLRACLFSTFIIDHSGGNLELISFLEKNDPSKDNIKVYGGSKKIPGLTTLVGHESHFKLESAAKAGGHDEGSIEVTCLATPCHTGDSICYYLKDPRQGGPGCVFTGSVWYPFFSKVLT
jgi:hydroxyacylglutathione hydrolase